MELPEPEILQIGDMSLDMERGILSKGNRSHQLGPKKLTLMMVFGQYPNRILAEARLRLVLYGDEWRSDSAVRANIRGCRQVMKYLRSKARIKVIVDYGWEFVPPTG